MRVLIVGANGNIGRRLIQQMASGPHQSQATIRDAKQAAELRELGADATVVADLEHDIQAALDGCDAVIFTAGSGGKGGAEKTDAVDRDGAIAVIDAAQKAGVERFVMVSSMGADTPGQGPEGLQHYLAAKQAADEHLRESDLHYTIVRPGTLSDEAGSGRVEIAKDLGRHGTVPRDDVATVLLQVLGAKNTWGKQFELLSGTSSVSAAVAAI
ncbi:SDR family oxidoreductase [Lysobacter ciconiae]|uniref:SDR family oxidoreductase n=1 Tax=Novilysobacter ciconiae TaxID=2781022 RepID=A0A7S6UHV8_9GAMM|nr:SDR family oxidoreductase [Lysobacter ciconiae]QOW20593.1 SDR family oxidoreductase [Lysobacter ciconiae]